MKRIPHLIAGVCLIVSLIALPALASDGLVIEVVNRTAEPGDVIEVAINITANPAPGVSAIKDLRIELGAGLTLYYPQGAAAYNNGAGARATWPFIAGGGEHAGGNGLMIPLMGRPSHMNISDSHIVFNFQDIGFPFNSTETGTLISIWLKVAEDFPGGDIGIILSGGAYDSINPSVLNKTPALVNGRVYVVVNGGDSIPSELNPNPNVPDGNQTDIITDEAPWVNIFSDLSPDDTHYDAIAFMNRRGLMEGYGDGRVGPHDKLTRAQIATLLWNLEGKPDPNGSAWFFDVVPGTWHHDAIQWTAENRVVNGIGDGRFLPDPYITRQEMMQILYNYAVNFKGYSIVHNLEMPEYADNNAISEWAVPAATRMVEAGVMFGIATDELKPTDTVNRAETAAIFRNFMRFIAEEPEATTGG
jgi:hypothetical protein